MSTDTPPSPVTTPTVTELLTGILGDLQELGIQHLAMFRHEVKEDFRKMTDAITTIIVGLAIAQIGVMLLAMMLVHLLIEMVPNLAMWMCYGIVGAVLAVAGGVAITIGINKSQRIEALSSQTAEIIKDDAKWLANSN